jgi:hypothetical protein
MGHSPLRWFAECATRRFIFEHLIELQVSSNDSTLLK